MSKTQVFGHAYPKCPSIPSLGKQTVLSILITHPASHISPERSLFGWILDVFKSHIKMILIWSEQIRRIQGCPKNRGLTSPRHLRLMCTIVSFGVYRRLAFTVQQEENAARWAPALFFTPPPTHHHLSCCKAALQRRYYISHLGACKIVQICPDTQILRCYKRKWKKNKLLYFVWSPSWHVRTYIWTYV